MKGKADVRGRAFARVVAVGKTHYVTLPAEVMTAAAVRKGQHIAWAVHKGIMVAEIVPWEHIANLPKGYRRMYGKRTARAAKTPAKTGGAE